MTREEATLVLDHARPQTAEIDRQFYDDEDLNVALDMGIKALEQEPCCNCIEFKRCAKQTGFTVEKQSIPYLMHKEMGIPLLECQKAYDVAIEYLRSQSKIKG